MIHLNSSNADVETPVKDRRATEPLTAESEQDASPTFEDISAEELFRQFSELVTVTEEECETHIEEEDLERRLTYDSFPSYKLEFEPKSSMRKSALKKEVGHLRASALFRPQPLQQVKPSLAGQNDCECFTPVDRVRKEHPELLETPHKCMER
jgi:hypothetical protein